MPITLPTPDLTPDVPADIPSTIIAPDLSLSTLDTEMEIERSLPWTPAPICRPIGLASPGATTIASGHSAVLSHGDMVPPVVSRPQNPSPPSLPMIGESDTSTLRSQQQQQKGQLYQSFLPQLSVVDGALGDGSGATIDEFGAFLSEREHEWEEYEEDSGGSSQISLRGALALPIPLLVTPRQSESDLRATPGPGLTRPRIPVRLLRWRNSTGAAGARRDEVVRLHAEREQEMPEQSWHGIDLDPFRCSPHPSVPTEERETGSRQGGCRDPPSGSPRVDTTFRWSTASLEMSVTPGVSGHGHGQAHAHTPSFTGLTALTRRICEQGRVLLRKSRSNIHLPRPRLLPGSSPRGPSPLLPPLIGTAAAIEGGFGSLQHIGLGIGYSLPSRCSSPRRLSQPVRATCAPTRARGHEAQKDTEETALVAGCYTGLGGSRWAKKNGAQQQRGTSRPEPSPSDSRGVLILGNPGFGGAAVPAPTGNI
jgi:hypothetical protein